MMRKRKTLAEELAELANPAPNNGDVDDWEGAEAAKVIDTDQGIYDDEITTTQKDLTLQQRSLRRNADLEELEQAYQGKVVKGNDIFQSLPRRGEDDDGEAGDGDDGDGDEGEDEGENGFDEGGGIDDDDEEEEGGDGLGDIEEEDHIRVMQRAQELEQQAIMAPRTSSDTEQAASVRNQKAIWDFILQTRIKLQAVITSSNRMPRPTDFQELGSGSEEVGEAYAALRQETLHLLTSMERLQNGMMDQTQKKGKGKGKGKGKKGKGKRMEDDDNGEGGGGGGEEGSGSSYPSSLSLPHFPSSGPGHTSEENEGDEGEERGGGGEAQAEVVWRVMEERWNNTVPTHRNILDLWNTKTQVASGGTLQNKTFKVINQSIVTQVDVAVGDAAKLRRRTQLKRVESLPITSKPMPKKQKSEETVASDRKAEYDEEVFDDNDFYSSLLSDVILTTQDYGDDGLLRIAQTARRKVQKGVDRRASKGRKIRYEAFPKLSNFMVPITKHDETFVTEQLFSSLFGTSAPPPPPPQSSNDFADHYSDGDAEGGDDGGGEENDD